jgi:hypothetical protein
LPALDKDAADVITGSEHILKAYAVKHALTATAIVDLIKDVLKNSRQRDWEPAVQNQHGDVALWKDLSSSNLCGSSCGIAQKEGAGIQASWR